MQAASDEAILLRAREEHRVVVSADSDPGAILAAQETECPSFILFREPNLLSASDYVDMLLPVLPMLEPELTTGCVASFEEAVSAFADCPFSE